MEEDKQQNNVSATDKKNQSEPKKVDRKKQSPQNEDKGVPPVPPRGSKAAFVWFIIFISLGVLMIFRLNLDSSTADWEQSKFEQELLDGNITSVTLNSETDRVVSLEGTYRIAQEQLAAMRKRGLQVTESGKFRSRVIYSDRLDELLDEAGVAVKVGSKNNWWNLLATILPVLLIVGVIYFLFSRQIKMAGRGAMQFGKSRARMILPSDLNITFDAIAGADEAKEETKEIIDFLKDPLKFKLLGGKIPKGVLLMGPPGTGKTLLAKAVACEANVPFFSISGSDFVEMFVGVGASRVRDMFEQARKNTPCLIFIDEIDAVGRSRFSGMGGGHDEREQTLNAMLVEMDGLESRSGVIVLAATNRPDVLDPALLRPGRFDRQIVLDLPDIAGRRKILDVHIKDIRIGKQINLDAIAKSTPGFSGADLANLCNEAALLAARNNLEFVVQDDLEEARDKVRWGRERRSRKISEKERKLTAYHEGGHALAAIHSKNATPVHKVTIIPRGQAYLGATMTLPEEDVYTQSRNELFDELVVLMGGRVAEAITFNDITSGASSDIERASHLARLMVCQFGMNDHVGPIKYGEHHDKIHVRVDTPPAELYSQETAREIDVEVKKLICKAHDKARDLIKQHQDQLELLAGRLLEKETLSIEQIRQLLGIKKTSVTASDEKTSVQPEAVGAENTSDADVASTEPGPST